MLKSREDEFNCRRLPNRSIRHVTRPRWVAMFHGDKRVVGLLVPRSRRQDPYGRSFLHYTADGQIIENRIGYTGPDGDHGEWYTARANELPRQKWQAIRNFYLDLPPADAEASR
ncbi:hypothetical protein DMB38_20565 [Streptomyces sp. WAC 06738]|uniref:hypothetical protein n=1 Tax=Streptomyces sp. WAC 06738 TaxID=2203210 RepID=UPI000F6DC949|nr:hypothetical protein [Streptomyces sp. WAC 06738]AZM47864.1 hypothetical protein DMB38_20565 [Streptomyces sp. WAC 06738]